MDSASGTELWVICPVCQKANPAGVRFCQHCWGAAIHQDTPITTEEVEELERRRVAYLKRRKRIKVSAISLFSLAILLTVGFNSFYFTDAIYRPHKDINSNSPSGEWAMFRHDLGRSGSAEPTGILPQGTLKWTFSTGASIHSSPVVADGIVYIGSQDYKFYALDADTGAKLWEYTTGSWVESSPAVVNGVVYFGSNDGSLYALDAHNGEKIWSFETEYPVRSSPAIADNVVYFGSDDYYLYAVDAQKGTKLWDFNTGSLASSSPVVSRGIVYIGSGRGYCYALNSLNGHRRLRYNTHYPTYSSPAVSDGTVYISTVANGYLYAFDGMARSWLWEHEIVPIWLQFWVMVRWVPRPPPQSGFLWTLSLGMGDASSPMVAGDTLYLGWGKKLLAIDLQSHEKRWEFKTGGTVRSSPAAAGSAIFVGSEDGRLYAVDAATGKKLWDFLTGDKITSSPAVANGVVYIGSHDGNLYAIE